MRKLIFATTAFLSISGLVATSAQAARPVKVIHTLGQAPLKTCGQVATRHTKSAKAFGLTPGEGVELAKLIADKKGQVEVIPNGTRFDIYLGCHKGTPTDVANRATPELRVPYTVTSVVYTLASGQSVEIIDSEGPLCGNWVKRASYHYTPIQPPKVIMTYTPPTIITPPPTAMEPIFERQLVEREVVDKAKIEYEAIAGVYVGASRLYKFHGAYVEGSIKIPVGDNTSLLVGGMAMMGSGESRVSNYHGKESRFGPQIGLQHVYLKTHNVDGLEMQLPAVDTLKIRYLWDRMSGSNLDSGYSFKQRGTVLNFYAEHVERINPNTLVGVTGGVTIPLTSSIRSTWSGDRPQNRSYYELNGFVQKRINNDLQVRYIAGLSHQGWDKVNYLSLGAELRWKETVMCGPRLSLALNRPESYRPYGIGSLHTLMAYCRLELGGTVRTMDRRHREKQWQLVQVGMRPVTREETLEPESSSVYIPPVNALVVDSNLTINPALPLVIKTPINLNIED